VVSHVAATGQDWTLMVPFSIIQVRLKSCVWTDVEYLGGACPAGALVEVKSLMSPNSMLEIEAIAMIAA
jgi:enamine deaminase RidA (YjgF/YER057c/UK114 family)